MALHLENPKRSRPATIEEFDNLTKATGIAIGRSRRAVEDRMVELEARIVALEAARELGDQQ